MNASEGRPIQRCPSRLRPGGSCRCRRPAARDPAEPASSGRVGVCVTLPMLPFAAGVRLAAGGSRLVVWTMNPSTCPELPSPRRPCRSTGRRRPADGAGRRRPAGGPGRIVLAATPIGNVGDASPGSSSCSRRRTSSPPRTPGGCTGWCRASASPWPAGSSATTSTTRQPRPANCWTQVRSGKTLVMVTDAGMPSVSDPGFRLVEGAVAAGLTVTAAPGPSAVLTALALSGLPTDRFCFEGFLPRKAGERSSRLADLDAERRTMVFFEAPHRLEPMLRALHERFGAEPPRRRLPGTDQDLRRGHPRHPARTARMGGDQRGPRRNRRRGGRRPGAGARQARRPRGGRQRAHRAGHPAEGGCCRRRRGRQGQQAGALLRGPRGALTPGDQPAGSPLVQLHSICPCAGSARKA